MDSKDFQLLAALYENARQSYRSLARRVSLSAPAVRDRLRGLEKRGVIQGYWVDLDPSIVDREDLLVFFRGNWTREGAVKALGVQDVGWVAWKVDGGLTVRLMPRNREQGVEDLVRTVGDGPSGQAWVQHPKRQPLSLVEWRIIDALLDNPKMGLKELCEATGLSPKTVRKHVVMLIRDEIIFVTPKLGNLADPGEVVYHLAVTGRIELAEVCRVLGDAVLVNETREPEMKYLLCRANDRADVTSRISMISKLSNVDSVTVSLNRELLVASEFVRKLVREKHPPWGVRSTTLVRYVENLATPASHLPAYCQYISRSTVVQE